jgi:hypothetical protein
MVVGGEAEVRPVNLLLDHDLAREQLAHLVRCEHLVVAGLARGEPGHVWRVREAKEVAHMLLLPRRRSIRLTPLLPLILGSWTQVCQIA